MNIDILLILIDRKRVTNSEGNQEVKRAYDFQKYRISLLSFDKQKETIINI